MNQLFLGSIWISPLIPVHFVATVYIYGGTEQIAGENDELAFLGRNLAWETFSKLIETWRLQVNIL